MKRWEISRSGRLSVSVICEGHQWKDQQSVRSQTTYCQFQEHPQEISHESERKTRHDGCEGCHVINHLCRMLSYLYIGENGRTLKVCMADNNRPRVVKNKIPRMELPCMSKRLHIPSIGKKQGSFQGWITGKEKGSWSSWDPAKQIHDESWCRSISRSVMDYLCSLKEWMSCDRKCLGKKPKSYLRKASFTVLWLAEDDPQGRSIQGEEF